MNNLPIEVLERIGLHAEPEDRVGLRLINRRTARATNNLYDVANSRLNFEDDKFMHNENVLDVEMIADQISAILNKAFPDKRIGKPESMFHDIMYSKGIVRNPHSRNPDVVPVYFVDGKKLFRRIIQTLSKQFPHGVIWHTQIRKTDGNEFRNRDRLPLSAFVLRKVLKRADPMWNAELIRFIKCMIHDGARAKDILKADNGSNPQITAFLFDYLN